MNVSPLMNIELATAVMLPTAAVAGRVVEQVALQVPQALVLPSSHTSVPATIPSPQIGLHDEGAAVPPVQLKPASTLHCALQPSPETGLPSSQVSPDAPLT
jgi:hypothetical protein